MVLKKRPPSKWTSGSTDLYRVSQAPEMHLLGCGLLKLPWIKGPAFGHWVWYPRLQRWVLRELCARAPVGILRLSRGRPWGPVRENSSTARSCHESQEGHKVLAAILMSFPLALLLQANLALFFFFFPFIPTCPHEFGGNICAKSSMSGKTQCQDPARPCLLFTCCILLLLWPP